MCSEIWHGFVRRDSPEKLCRTYGQVLSEAHTMSEQPHYSMVIEWSDEDHIYIVSLPEWGTYAQTHGATYNEAVCAGQEVLHMLVDSARKVSPCWRHESSHARRKQKLR